MLYEDLTFSKSIKLATPSNLKVVISMGLLIVKGRPSYLTHYLILPR